MNTKNYSLLCINLITFNFFFSKIRVVEININLKVFLFSSFPWGIEILRITLARIFIFFI